MRGQTHANLLTHLIEERMTEKTELENKPPTYDECESLAHSLCEAIHCSGDNKSREIAYQSLYEFYQLNPACYYRDYRENNESR